VTDMSTLSRTMLQPDVKRMTARSKAAQAYGGKIKQQELYDLASELMRVPGSRDLKKFKDAMKKADGASAEYGANELSTLALSCMRAAAGRTDAVGTAAKCLLRGLAAQPQAPHALHQTAMSLPLLDEIHGYDVDAAPQETLLTFKKNFDSVRATGNHSAIGQHGLPYIEALEAREKLLAKAVQGVQADHERQQRMARMFAWACLRQRPDGTHYDDLGIGKAAVAVAFDLHSVGWPDAENAQLDALIDLVLAGRASVSIELSDAVTAIADGLRSDLAASFGESQHLPLAFYYRALVGIEKGTAAMRASDLTRVLVREFHWLRAGIDGAGGDS
jgi:hypothetical protein